MKLLVMGSTGMLGKAFMRSPENGFELTGASRQDLDFTNKLLLTDFLDKRKPEVVINTAANINLRQCEDFPEDTGKINVELVRNLSGWCAQNDALLVQVSTDHVYDSAHVTQHKEDDELTLVNEYARQKRLAEEVAISDCRSLVFRTNILGYRDSRDKTFIEWILHSVKYDRHISGFTDSFVSAIDVDRFVEIALLSIAENLRGCFNVGCSEVFSKYELIRRIIANLDDKDVVLTPASVSALCPRRAKSCGLDVTKISNELGIMLPTLNMVIENLNISEKYNEL